MSYFKNASLGATLIFIFSNIPHSSAQQQIEPSEDLSKSQCYVRDSPNIYITEIMPFDSDVWVIFKQAAKNAGYRPNDVDNTYSCFRGGWGQVFMTLGSPLKDIGYGKGPGSVRPIGDILPAWKGVKAPPPVVDPKPERTYALTVGKSTDAPATRAVPPAPKPAARAKATPPAPARKKHSPCGGKGQRPCRAKAE